MNNLSVNRKSYGFEIDLRQYIKSDINYDIHAAFFADRSSAPQIVKKNGGVDVTYYGKHGNSWHSEALNGNSHQLAENSVEHEALEILKRST